MTLSRRARLPAKRAKPRTRKVGAEYVDPDPAPAPRSLPPRRARKLRPHEIVDRGDRPTIRDAVFARDGHRCQLAGVAGAGDCWGPLTPHHLKKASAGGGYTMENLKTLCAGHNSWVEDYPNQAHALGLVIRRGDDRDA